MRGYYLPENHVVSQVGRLNFTGNIIPHTWYNHISLENGKTDLAAIVILAELVYWYRPFEEKDVKTGEFLGWKKKFKADKLQRHYDTFVEQFGLTKNQVKRATDNLVRLGLIDKEFRTITILGGQKLGNVLFIGLNVEKLAEITYTLTQEETPYDIPTKEGKDSNSIGGQLEVDTNTETSTDIEVGDNGASRSSPPLPPTEKASAGGLNNSTSSHSPRNHPAIQAIKLTTGYFPPKELYEPIINLLGDEPDMIRLKRNFTLWRAKGHNPMNLNGWLFDWYANDAYYTNPADKAVLEFI